MICFMSYLVLFCSSVFPHLGKRELILALFVRLFDLCLFGIVGFLFSWCLGRAAVCDCDTPWTFLLPFFFSFFFFFFFCIVMIVMRMPNDGVCPIHG